MSAKQQRTYLGDGVYVWMNTWNQIVLETDADGETRGQSIVIEPEVWERLQDFINSK